jgi:hypothetical protein
MMKAPEMKMKLALGAAPDSRLGAECPTAEWMMVEKQKKKKKMPKWVKPKAELRIFKTIMPESVNAITKPGEWECIELAVDSGATETVVGEDMLTSVETKDGWASKHGVEYEVANGERIPNMGEKKFEGITQEGLGRNITAQVCDVNKALLSVKKITAAGNRVVFDDEGSFIQDKVTQEKLWLREDNGMYMLKMWVKTAVF